MAPPPPSRPRRRVARGGGPAREMAACAGETWPAVARRVGRIADWLGDAENLVGLR